MGADEAETADDSAGIGNQGVSLGMVLSRAAVPLISSGPWRAAASARAVIRPVRPFPRHRRSDGPGAPGHARRAGHSW